MAYTLEEMKRAYPNSLAGLNDADAIYKIAQLTGENPQALAEEYGVIASGQGDFARGMSSGADSFQAGLYGLAGWAGAATGVDKVRDWGYEGYQRNMGEVQLRAKSYDNIEEAEGFGDYVDSAQYWVGYAIPQILGAVVGGKGSGVLAKKAIEKKLKKEMAEKFGKNTGAINAVMNSKKTQSLLDTAAKRGSYAGIGAQAFGTELGHTYGGAVDEQIAEGHTIEDVNLKRATGYGLAAGAAEFGADVLTLGLARLGPAKNLLNPAGKFTSSSRLVNAAVRTPVAAGLEAGTELVQTGLEEMGAGKTFEEADFLDPTSAWAGAWGGGPMGLAGGLASKKVDPNAKINEALKEAALESVDDVDQVDQAQREADANAAEFEADIAEQEELREVHSKTFPSPKAWEEEQKVEKELVQRAQLQDPNSELSLAFKAWRKQNQIYLSNDPKENEIITKKFLKKHNKDTTGTTHAQDLRDAHMSALDAHAALQEAKKGRADEKQAEIDKALKDFWGRREAAIAEGNTQEVLAIEKEVEALDKAIPNEQVMAEWDETKRALGNEAALAEAAAAAAAEEAAKGNTEKVVVEDEVVTPPVVEDEVVTPPVVEDEVVTPPVVEDEVVTPPVVEDEVVTPPVVEDEVVTPPVEDTTSIDESVQSINIRHKNVGYNVDRNGRVTNEKTGVFKATASFPDSFPERVRKEFEEIDAAFRAKLAETEKAPAEEVGPPVTPNPFEDKKYRNVKGKKTLNKRWQRFDAALKEFGQDFETQYEFLRTAIYQERLPSDSTYSNVLEVAKELKKDREIVGGIFGKEMRVMGQVHFRGKWQKPVIELLLDAAKRGSLHDYLYHEDGKWKFAMQDIAKDSGVKSGESSENDRKAVEKALNAYRKKQELYGEMSEKRETVGEFLDRTLRKMGAQEAAVEELSTAEVAKQIAANEFVGMRLQKRPSDTAVGTKPKFNILDTKKESKEIAEATKNLKKAKKQNKSAKEIQSLEKILADKKKVLQAATATPAKKIKLRLDALEKRVPILKRAATNAEKKAKAYPKNKGLQALAKSKRRVADRSSDELIGLQDEGKEEIYNQERASLVAERGEAHTAHKEAKKRLSEARQKKVGTVRIEKLEKVVEAKQTALAKVKEKIKGLMSPEEKRKLAVQRVKDLEAKKKGELPEGTPTPEFLKQQEKEQEKAVRLAELILSDTGARDDVAGEWGAMRSKDMPIFSKLTKEHQFEWAATVATAKNEHNYGNIDVLQNSMERRIRNEETYSKSTAKDQEVDKGPSADDTTKEGSGTAADTSGQKDSKSKPKLTIKAASAYAKKKLGKNWRTKYPNLPKYLVGKNLLQRIKNQNFATFNKLVDRYAAQEAEVTTSKMDTGTSQMGEVVFDSAENKEKQEEIETMFRRMLGEKGYRKIRKRVYFFKNAAEAKKVMDMDLDYDHVIGRESAYVQKWRPRISGKPDIIVFILNRVSIGKAISTFMHEVGGHIGLDNILTKSEQKALQNKIRQWHIEDKAKYGNEEFYDLSLEEILNASDGVIADNPWGQLADSTEHLIARYAIRKAMSEGYIDKTTGKVPADVATSETLAFFVQVGVEIGVRPDGLWSFKNAPDANMILQKFRQAFRKFLGFVKGDRLDITAEDIIDMAYGAAKIELETGIRRPGQKMVRDIRASEVTTSRQVEPEEKKQSSEYWQKKIDDFVARKIPKNDKNKYITENGQYLEPKAWSQWQQSQGRKEKAMRAGLKNIVEQRQKDAAKHEQSMQDPDNVTTSRQVEVDSDTTLNPPARQESKEEVEALRDWLAKTFNPTVVQIYDNMSHLFFKGTGATKFVHQLINDVAEKLPAAKAWYDNVLLSEKSRQRIKMLVEDIVVRARELSKPHLKEVNRFIAKSTTEQLWAYNPHNVDDPRHAKVEAQLKDKSNKEQVLVIKTFNGMTKEQQAIIKDVFAHGEAMLARKRAIAEAIFGKGAPDKFFGTSGLTGPYAPLRRFGNFISEFKSQELLVLEEAYAELDSPENLKKYMDKKGQSKHYRITFHGTIGAARRDVDENKGDYSYSRAFEKSKNVTETRAPEYKVFQKVLAGLNATDIPPGSPEFNAINDMVHEMYFNSLDEDNARHSQIKRQGYAGYDEDMLKGFKANATSEANLIANMEHGKAIYSALAETKTASKGNAKLERVYNLIVSHHTASLDTRQTVFRALQDKVAAVNTVYMLTSSIGYHVTNATQVMMVTIPKLVGDFGTGNYGKAMKLYFQGLRIASDVVSFNWKKFKFQTKIDIDKAPEKYRALLEELQLRQLLDVGMDQDLAEFGRADSGFDIVNKGNEAASTFSHRLYQVARLVEAYNRISTATAAFELAQDNTNAVKKMGYNNELTEDNSVQYAIRMVEDTQGNFSSIDAPLILKKMPKVTGQYRKYQIMMAWVYADATKKSFAGASPEEKAAGRRTIGVLLGHAGVFSGAVGIPFSHMIAALFMGIGEGDEPEDLERWIQENVQDKTLAKMISRGLPSVFGVDMNTKLSQQKIFSAAPYTDFALTEDALKAAFFEVLVGPSAATASNIIRSHSYAKEGNAWRAIEYALPKGVRTAMESYRLSTEGYTLRNGDVVSSPGDFSGWQLVVNALGIPATDIKEMKWKRGQQYELGKWFGETQSRLRKEYVKAKKEGNSGDVRNVIDEWKRLQQSKDRVRPFFNNERSALKKTPLASLFKATRQQLEREAKYLAQLKP